MSYKQVIAIGDSFTRGDELADCPQHHSEWSSHTWPALVASDLNCKYDCAAIGGKGNQWISWQTAIYIHEYRSVNPLFIVNWSWFERFDYVDIDDNLWSTTHPRHEDKLDHYFYRNLDSELWNVHRNLQQIHSTVALLRQHNIDFIMTCLDPLYNLNFASDRDSQCSWIKGLRKATSSLAVSREITHFDNSSFLDWSRHSGFQCGPNGHPLEAAHAAAAKYIQRTVPLLH